ncbi:hypothetical protein T492DRAFT_842292 [Pavlovales sp. CCMP2436]|nr:hypothetical protein T492DRAFT_842292 [Pavlovales sp. CCMP2436]
MARVRGVLAVCVIWIALALADAIRTGPKVPASSRGGRLGRPAAGTRAPESWVSSLLRPPAPPPPAKPKPKLGGAPDSAGAFTTESWMSNLLRPPTPPPRAKPAPKFGGAPDLAGALTSAAAVLIFSGQRAATAVGEAQKLAGWKQEAMANSPAGRLSAAARAAGEAADVQELELQTADVLRALERNAVAADGTQLTSEEDEADAPKQLTRRVAIVAGLAFALTKPVRSLFDDAQLGSASYLFQRSDSVYKSASSTLLAANNAAARGMADGDVLVRALEVGQRTLAEGNGAVAEGLRAAQTLEASCSAATRRLSAEKVALSVQVDQTYEMALALPTASESAKVYALAEEQTASFKKAAELEDSFLLLFADFQRSVASLLGAQVQALAAVESAEAATDGARLTLSLYASAVAKAKGERALRQPERLQLEDAAKALKASSRAASRSAVAAREASALLRKAAERATSVFDAVGVSEAALAGRADSLVVLLLASREMLLEADSGFQLAQRQMLSARSVGQSEGRRVVQRKRKLLVPRLEPEVPGANQLGAEDPDLNLSLEEARALRQARARKRAAGA